MDRTVEVVVLEVAWTLRPATASDRDFVVELTRTAMGAYLATAFGWDQATQNAYFETGFDPSGGQIIQVDGVRIGELLVDARPGELHLVRIALLPDWQGRGIGSAIVQTLSDRARELDAALVLQVFKTNPRATQLYESLGFVRTGENETEVLMRLEPKV